MNLQETVEHDLITKYRTSSSLIKIIIFIFCY